MYANQDFTNITRRDVPILYEKCYGDLNTQNTYHIRLLDYINAGMSPATACGDPTGSYHYNLHFDMLCIPIYDVGTVLSVERQILGVTAGSKGKEQFRRPLCLSRENASASLKSNPAQRALLLFALIRQFWLPSELTDSRLLKEIIIKSHCWTE
jgi:hypothetical protein